MELTYPTSFAVDARKIKKLGSIDDVSWYSDPVSSGPYRLDSWTSSGIIVLAPNKYYASPRPAVRKVVISLGQLPDSGIYQYVSHNLDAVGIPFDPDLVHRPGIHQTRMLAIDGVYMNMRAKPFSDKTVREALTLALDRRAAVRATMGSSVAPFEGYVPSGEAGFDVALRPLPYNPALARRLLKQAGYATGKAFPQMTLYYGDDPAVPQIGKLAKAIVRDWHRNLGITVGSQPLTLNTLLARAQSNSLPLYVLGWSADYPDPHDWLSLQWESTALNNNVHYHSARFDALAQTADATWSYANRMRYYNECQQLLVNDAAWIPMYIPYRLVYVSPTVSNLAVTGYGLIPSGGSWARVQVHLQAPRQRGASRADVT
jgi:peptide/nickel transport system substrate-binding protein/oligopeptide transport system substrate-binding protein